MPQEQYFERFFQQRGTFSVKPNNEADIKCPFKHSKGYDTRPSAHVNVDTRLFHCKTCKAEGRFGNGGLSEANFISKLHNISYAKALGLLGLLSKSSSTEHTWFNATANLSTNDKALDFLRNVRGLTNKTITDLRLGFTGDGLSFPVFFHGVLLDKRTYNPNWKEENAPKIKSDTGSSEFLFPYDLWHPDERDTLLVAGEFDCALTRQHGFNAVTSTGGEGSLPKLLLSQFRDRTVYIIYDCDDAGRTASRRVSMLLREVGANVLVVDLGLPGTKDDKDLTDFFLKHGRTADDLLLLMKAAHPYATEEFIEDKNKEYPLVDLWNVYHGEHSGHRLSSRVVMSGKYAVPMETPSAIEWKCIGPWHDHESPVCKSCPLRGKAGLWQLEDGNIAQLLHMVEVSPKVQEAAVRKAIHQPEECPGIQERNLREKRGITKVIFTPDVDTEDEESGYVPAEQQAYVFEKVVNDIEDMTDGQRYRIYFRRVAHPLQDQQIVLIVDRAEPSDNALNSFHMTPQIYEELRIFQGNPVAIMQDRTDRMHDITKLFKPNPAISNAVDIIYHSPLRFKFAGREMKGYPEGIIVGESRTGKTETAMLFQKYIRLGNFTELKNATTAGLLGGADKMANGQFRVNWGLIPRNHRGFVIMDEMSDMPQGVLSSLTSLRSERVASIQKIAKGKAPAETRMLWISNPKKLYGKSKNIKDYPTGVDVLIDLVGADEDIARFDFCMTVVKDRESSPLDRPEKAAHAPELYRNLILWAWSRKSNEVQFEEGVETYIVQIAKELNDKYDTDVKFFGSEAWKKLARIAVACAACCFSTDSVGTQLMVGKPHVDWAADFLRNCYDNPIFRLAEYVTYRRAFNETNEAVNTVVAGICRVNTMVVKALMQGTEAMPMGNLQAMSGLDRTPFSELINKLSQHNLIQVSQYGVIATRRFRLAVESYKADYRKSKMVPLAQEGTSPV